MTRAAARALAALLPLSLLAGCGGGLVVTPPADGRCASAEPWSWATAASDALQTRPFRRRQLYDLDANNKPVPFEPGPCADCAAVVSYPAPTRHPGGPDGLERLVDRSFTYDNALYALLRVEEGRKSAARAVLDTLAALQRVDGAWGFSFAIEHDGFYNLGYVRSGAVAWVLYAMARYERRYGEGRYRVAMRRAAGYLRDRLEPNVGLILGGYGRWSADGASFEPLARADWASTEHNIDAAFALRAAALADPEGGYLDGARLAAAIAERLFLGADGHYARGARPDGLDAEPALDAVGTWSALLDVQRGDAARAAAVLAATDRLLGGVDGPWRIWRPGDDNPAQTWFVEGSVARAIALHRLGRSEQARADLAQLARWACAGGVPLTYASRWAKDFPVTPAVAPTVWFVFAAREVLGIAPPSLWAESLALSATTPDR